MKTRRWVCLLAVILATTPMLYAGDFDSGSDGSDGALDCAALFALNPECLEDCLGGCEVEIDLSLAIPGDALTTPGTGDGVYDATRWAVVFKYETVTIPAGVTVTFKNHPKGAPVVWLATGDVVIDGTVSLNGGNGHAGVLAFSEPGPGGFQGGIGDFPGSVESGGLGPGGGQPGDAGSYGTSGEGDDAGARYGNPPILPLIGGSGGGGYTPSDPAGGGAGGGAILIASSTIILMDGTIEAIGGEALVNSFLVGAGSGGAIRLLANEITGVGDLNALGGTNGDDGGDGRIRLEAHVVDLPPTNPQTIPWLVPGPVFPTIDAPVLRATFVDAVPVPEDPDAGIETADVFVDTNTSVVLEIEAENVPLMLDPVVTVYVIPFTGNRLEYTFDDVTWEGTDESSSATVEIPSLPSGSSEIQLKVNWTTP